jgi:SNF2 family DNA or RNA helicase
MKCHQIANGLVYEDIPESLNDDAVRDFKKNRKSIKVHASKIEALKDLIDELNGKPLLIAYHYKHDLQALRSALGDVPHIGSGVDPQTTDRIVSDWNAGKIPILLGHPASMSHGLNLQNGGNDVCWFSLTWSLEDYLQFNARIYRQGVSGSVRIHRIIADKTIDQAMIMRLSERDQDQSDLRAYLDKYQKTIKGA